MSKTKLKLLLWALLTVVGLTGGLLAFAGLSTLVAYFQRGADPASALNIVPNRPPDLHVRLDWLPDAEDTGRAMEPFTRQQIEAAYLRAWLQWNLSHLRGEPFGLKTYFVGPALEAISDAVADTASQGWRISQVDSSHTVQLHFYAADGSIVSFTDHDALVAVQVLDADGNSISFQETRSTYDVVMFLEDGNWRVRHLVRVEGQSLKEPMPLTARPPAGFIHPRGTQLVLDGQPYRVVGINYYPRATPWDRFWPEYDPQIVGDDLALMESLGLNTVRIFVPFQQFGGPTVAPEMLQRLQDFLGQAEEHGLRVIVTLFDFRTDYSPLLWPQSDRHLEVILSELAGEPTILAWDLKNEPDLDYARAGRGAVDAWLAHTARLARQVDPNHLLTIGWSSPQAAATPELEGLVDVVSFHTYAPALEFGRQYEVLRAAVPAAPILLTEFGLPTWNSPLFPNGHTEAEQAYYYAGMRGALQRVDAAGYLAWTLHDFERVPASVAGRWPWQTGPQRHLGVVRLDGQPKPAASLLAPDAALQVPRYHPWRRFLKPFWLTVYGAVGVVLMAIWWWNRGRRARSG